jgi:hypothetical protein
MFCFLEISIDISQDSSISMITVNLEQLATKYILSLWLQVRILSNQIIRSLCNLTISHISYCCF